MVDKGINERMEIKAEVKLKKISLIIMVFAVIAGASLLAVNFYIVNSTKEDIAVFVGSKEVFQKGQEAEIMTDGERSRLVDASSDCILVLGAGLKADGTPNHMLLDRLEVALALYRQSAAPKLLLSGDHGQKKYDEVNAMRTYMEDNGVPKEDIFLDHAGFSTYESMYRAKKIFKVETAVVVTQKYHQYRALYIGKKMGMKCYGACSDQRTYVGQGKRELREILARDKDFFKTILHAKPTYMGDAIPISGNGLLSHD